MADQEDEFEFDDDQELNSIREKRLAELKTQSKQREEFLSKNHGSYREITEEDFLKEVLASKWVVVHFYHKEFSRCKIVDRHMPILAREFLEAKFLQIDVEKSPFFCFQTASESVACNFNLRRWRCCRQGCWI